MMISEPVLVVAVPAVASEAYFALVESTESAGGFAIPITIDPSIILSGSGALGPVRDVAG